jgi:beta-lactamase regulating signal transducer with metallopeptidase domain
MTRIDGLVLTFALNALWQIPLAVVAGFLGDRLLARAPARLRHALWLAVLAACVLLPVASLPRLAPAPARPELAAATAPSVDEERRFDGFGSGPSRPAPVPARAAAVAVWLYGLSLVFHGIGLGRALRQARRLRFEAWPLEIPEAAAGTVARCRAALRGETVRILGSPNLRGPVTVGAFRPVILLPHRFLESVSPQDAGSALGHEMAHVRRRDYAVNLLCETLLLPIAFHPAVRLLRRRLAETREMACDEAVVETLIGRRAYARSLLSLAAAAAGLPRPSITLGVADARTLEVRMKRILDDGPRTGARRSRALLGAALLLLGAGAAAASLLSFQAVSAETRGGDLAPFVGKWTGDWPLDGTSDKRMPALELEVEAKGRIVATWYWRLAPMRPGEPVETQKLSHEVTGYEVRGRVLTLIDHVPDFKTADGRRVAVDFRQTLELRSGNEAVFVSLSNSYHEAAKQRGEPVPPPPPPIAMKRVS